MSKARISVTSREEVDLAEFRKYTRLKAWTRSFENRRKQYDAVLESTAGIHRYENEGGVVVSSGSAPFDRYTEIPDEGSVSHEVEHRNYDVSRDWVR